MSKYYRKIIKEFTYNIRREGGMAQTTWFDCDLCDQSGGGLQEYSLEPFLQNNENVMLEHSI